MRRVIKQENLPLCLRDAHHSAATSPIEEIGSVQTKAHSNGKAASSIADETLYSKSTLIVYILLCGKSVTPYENIYDSLAATGVFRHADLAGKISTVLIPVTEPTSEEQAQQWSKKYWPTVYKKHNLFGPQHNIIEASRRDISGSISAYMDLAAQAGQRSLDAGLGENIGAIIVDRSDPKRPKILIAAGDARWQRQGMTERIGGGNAMAHAVMRAIGMIARKRRECSSGSQSCGPVLTLEDHFAEAPLTDTERKAYMQSSINPGGYLCLDLEMYVTHEPCVMCCMAMLHSRFGKIVFGIRMTSTGGLVAEQDPVRDVMGLGYGLFWRPILNWKFLAWQWIQDNSSQRTVIEDELHA